MMGFVFIPINSTYAIAAAGTGGAIVMCCSIDYQMNLRAVLTMRHSHLQLLWIFDDRSRSR